MCCLSYLIKEVLEPFQKFTKLIVSHAPSGSCFLFIDRNEPWLQSRVIELAGATGLTTGSPVPTNRNMDTDEEKTDSGRIYEVAKRMPVHRWNAFWVVGTKN